MAKFRKKPVVIEAEQWRPGDGEQSARLGFSQYAMSDGPWGASINTLEGQMHLSPGDWIITGVKGERYPYKPDIFEMTYEAVPTLSELRQRKYDPSMEDGYYWVWYTIRGEMSDARVVEIEDGRIFATGAVRVLGPRGYFGWIKIEPPEARLVAVQRAETVLGLLGDRPLMCLGTTKAGRPRHPLYTPDENPLVRFAPTAKEASHA